MTDRKKPILEPKTQAFVDALAAQGGKPLYELSHADARKLLEDAQAIEVTKLPADVEDRTLPTRRRGFGEHLSPERRQGPFAGGDVLPWRGLDIGQ
jgi:hypothetical protein